MLVELGACVGPIIGEPALRRLSEPFLGCGGQPLLSFLVWWDSGVSFRRGPPYSTSHSPKHASFPHLANSQSALASNFC